MTGAGSKQAGVWSTMTEAKGEKVAMDDFTSR